MNDDNDRRRFDKELAKEQVKATFASTAGAVFAGLGITLLTFGLATNFDALSKSGWQMQLFQGVGSVYAKSGLVIMFIGIGLLVAGMILIPRKIDKLK